MGEAMWWIPIALIWIVSLATCWDLARRRCSRDVAEMHDQIDEERRVTARVSHRLRNPLTVIYGFSEALLDTDFEDTAEVRSVVTIVNAEALDVSRTVEDLVTSTDLDRGDLRFRTATFDPSVEIERAVVPFRRLGAEIETECWSGIARSDPIRFRQIVQNLVSNAVRFGGSTISVVGSLRGSEFHCRVSDDGAGLPADVERHLFGGPAPHHNGPIPVAADPDQQEGLGLGLAVACAIAEGLGGSISYEQSGERTTFVITLPASDWSEDGGASEAAEVAGMADDAHDEPAPEGNSSVDHDPVAEATPVS